jgi:hypothetical protein
MKSKSVMNPERSMGNYWLTMSDASAFTVVQSCIRVATELRRDLADKAEVLSTHHPVDIAVILLSAAELSWGKGKGTQLAGQIVNLDKCGAVRKATAYKIIRQAISQLPLTLWGPEKMSSRRELLDELEKNAFGAMAEVPLLTTKAEKREQEWRDAIAAMRKKDEKQRAG